jgi:hypothetical protein
MSAERRREVLEPRREVVGDLQELADLVERLLRPDSHELGEAGPVGVEGGWLQPEEDLSLGSPEDPDKVVFVRHAGRERRGLDMLYGERSHH